LTVKELAQKLSFKELSISDADREVAGGYCGDLLSWVMGRAKEGDAWITIMSNINVIAVATLADVSCVVFAEDVMPDDDMIKVAAEKGVNLLVSPFGAFETANKISGIINE